MKTSELKGAALDWAVAKAEGIDWYVDRGVVYEERGEVSAEFHPSTDWALAGAIIEREKIGVWPCMTDEDGNEVFSWWYAETFDGYVRMGDTPLVAVMRCYVYSKLGDDVEVPEELAYE